jgi:nucleotide-binding universal stress UspA family protein
MFKRILVPLDGSERAERALPLAARVASASGGTVVLVRTVDVRPTAGLYYEIPGDLQADTLEARRTDAEGYLDIIARSAKMMGVTTQTVAVTGPTASTILSVADEQSANLIVMCSHGYGGMKRWALGSVAQHVTRQAHVPVMVLRENGPAAQVRLESGTECRILVALDGSELAEAALAPAAGLAQALAPAGAGLLHLVLVANPYDAAEHELTRDEAVTGATTYLSRVVDRLRTDANGALTVTYAVLVDYDVAATLTRAAGNGDGATETATGEGYEVIAMATHGRTGVALWAMGSVTERVLQSTKRPMLIVRPAQVSTTEKETVHLTARGEYNTWPGLL